MDYLLKSGEKLEGNKGFTVFICVKSVRIRSFSGTYFLQRYLELPKDTPDLTSNRIEAKCIMVIPDLVMIHQP